jgi:O-antigen/teichoic acid export membrane protein
MDSIQTGLRRLYNSSVVWSWVLNGFRLASGLLLLPLLLRLLPKEEFGMYYVFLNLIALVPIMDFGFSVSIGRYVSYAMGGATELKAMGLAAGGAGTTPNFTLLWRLLFTTRRLYRYLSLATLVVLGVAGTFTVGLRVNETASPQHAWLAWGITLLSAVLEIYAGWWNVFLRGMNQVLLSARIGVLAYALRLLLAAGLLLGGAGLLALPVAGLFTSLLQRQLARWHCLRRLGDVARPQTDKPGESLLRLLWPNSWRAGLQFLSSYLANNINALICLHAFGLAATGKFGLSLHVASAIQGMAMVWTAVKWPLVGQYRTRQDFPALRRMLWPRVWLQSVTYAAMAVAAVWVGPPLLRGLGSDKEILPAGWFALLLLNAFLEMNFSFWTTLLSTENRIPSLWPTVATNVASLLVVLLLLRFTTLGLGALVVAPLASASLFSYWFWAKEGARNLRTTWLRFTFLRPA